jgi:transketolase
VTLIRPADANEVSYAWKIALERTTGPTLLVLTRQNLPVYDRDAKNGAELTEKGAYVLAEANSGKPDCILLASGSEVEIAMEAREKLSEKGLDARVVSMPSWELFDAQSEEYRESVLPSAIKKRVAIEAGSTLGWHKWIGEQGKVIGLHDFGASAPYQDLYEHFGLTADAVVDAILS